MKSTLRALLAVFLLGTGFLFAQSPPPSNLSGSSLRSWLKTNWYNSQHNQLGYTRARRYMYNRIDNKNNKITCVYGGYQRNWNYGGTGTNPYPINAEHTVPQSWFNSNEPMRSDLHHLFPSYANINSQRGALPFGDISDSQTTKWWRYTSYRSSTPSSSTRNQYSEYKSGLFEPREDHKGNCARAVFYFYTMYPTQAGSISQIGDLNTLYQWHLNDPVDANEISRNNSIASYQGNRNPYVSYPDLVARAWGFSSGGGGGGGASQLFISEYVEGSSNNKGIEIANFTGSSVSLSSYKLKKQTNGSGSWSGGLTLSGTLSNGQVYVVTNSSATSSLKNQADKTSGGAEMTFNGNDAVGLFYNNSLIDIIGTFNGGSSNFAKDVTKRRKSSVSGPRTSYLTSEWDTYSQNTFSGIGSHSYSAKMAALPQVLAAPRIGAYPNPFRDRLSVDLSEVETQALELNVFDLQGRIVWQSEVQGGDQLEIDLQYLQPGIYFLKMQGEGILEQRRLVKQ